VFVLVPRRIGGMMAVGLSHRCVQRGYLENPAVALLKNEKASMATAGREVRQWPLAASLT